MLMHDPIMITNDPLIRLQRRQQMLLMIFMVLISTFLLASIILLFIPTFAISWKNVSDIFPTGITFALVILLFLSVRSSLKHRISQHQRLRTDASDLLAQEQPSPNEHALPRPTTITLHPKTGTMRAVYGILALVALGCAGLAVWGLVGVFIAPHDSDRFGGLILVAVTGGVALLFSVFIWFIWRHSHTWVKVTEIGLEARFSGRKMRIAWEDANFFSVDGKINSEKPLIYTLSGRRGGVIWTQLMSLSQASSPRPALPFHQYLQQCQALLEVVAGRTGLPLYDMRRPADY